MAFKPLNDKELAEQGLIPANEVRDFEILESVTLGTSVINLESRESAAGNPMIVAPVAIYNHKGDKVTTIIDYIVLTDRMMYKVKHLCEATGLMDEYNSGDEAAIVAKLAGKTGMAKIGIQKGNAEYPNDKNNIKDYMSGDGAVKAEPIDDEIPF